MHPSILNALIVAAASFFFGGAVCEKTRTNNSAKIPGVIACMTVNALAVLTPLVIPLSNLDQTVDPLLAVLILILVFPPLFTFLLGWQVAYYINTSD